MSINDFYRKVQTTLILEQVAKDDEIRSLRRSNVELSKRIEELEQENRELRDRLEGNLSSVGLKGDRDE